MKWINYLVVIALVVTGLHLLLGYLEPANFDPAAYLAKRGDYQVTIKRDVWGVPHIEGKRDADAAFGFAIAQAEDHYAIIEGTLRMYRGTQSSSDGYKSIPLDYLVNFLEIRDSVEKQYDTALSLETRLLLEGFADGMNYWAAKNEYLVDQSLYPITPQDLVAAFSLQHLFFYGLQNSLLKLFEETPEQALSAATNRTAWYVSEDEPLPIGSNAFAVSHLRSDDGSTRLLINSHQPMEGPVSWYEAHLRSEEGWHVMGGAFPGSPLFFLGTNEQVAWGTTVNKPDLFDVYTLKLNPNNSDQYFLDGFWEDFEVRQAKIRVKIIGNFYWTISEDLYYSAHGPVIRLDHASYAVKYAGHREIRQVEQWYRMSKADSLASWQKAMDMLAISSFNFVAADSGGNIGFFYNSQAPKRKQGFNWRGYLPGDRADLIWDEYIPFNELPHVINPTSGFVLSANQSPLQVSERQDNPLSTDYPESMGLPTRMTNRAVRGLELLKSDPKISKQEFYNIKFDNNYSENSRAIKYLKQLFSLNYPQGSQYREALYHLKNWDLSTDTDNTAAALGVCTISEEWKAEQARRDPPSVKQEFEKCVDLLLEKFDRVNVPWGEVNRIVRGEYNYGINGGPDVLRAIYGSGLKENGYLTAVGGDGLFMFVSWDKEGNHAVESIHQYGSATLNEFSPHYADQLILFMKEQMKQAFFDPSSLNQNVERTYTP